MLKVGDRYRHCEGGGLVEIIDTHVDFRPKALPLIGYRGVSVHGELVGTLYVRTPDNFRKRYIPFKEQDSPKLTVDQMREALIADDVQAIMQLAIDGDVVAIRDMINNYKSAANDTIIAIHFGRFG